MADQDEVPSGLTRDNDMVAGGGSLIGANCDNASHKACLQSLWDSLQLGSVIDKYDWRSVISVIVPSILKGDLSTLQQLPPKFIQDYWDEMMDAVLESRNSDVLLFLLLNGASAEDYYMDIAVHSYWREGVRILYEFGATAYDDIMGVIYRQGDWEMLAYGILNGFPIPDDFFFIHNILKDDLDLPDDTPSDVVVKLNEAFHSRMDEETAHEKRVAYRQYISCKHNLSEANSDDGIAIAREDLNIAKRRCRYVDPDWRADSEFESDDE